MPQAPNTVCSAKILGALNKVFSAQFMAEQVVWPDCIIHGGCYNLVLEAHGLSAAVFNALRPGRFRLSNWVYAWGLGGGNSLHLPRDGETSACCPPQPLLKSNVGGVLSARITAHLDHAFPYGGFGIGFVHHMIRDVAMAKTRQPCP